MHESVRVCMWCVYVYRCIPVCVYICVRVSSCVWLCGTAIRTRLVRSGPIVEDSELCSLWTRYDGDSKTDPWYDPGIHTSSCSEDQTVIWAETVLFHLSVCSYVISLFTVASRCLSIYSYYFIWSFDIFY